MKTAFLVVVVALIAGPVLAQGPFTDVPTDHWAYDAVDQLQKDGLLIGYPDGTFGGKRTITRYEFAVALARIKDLIKPSKEPEGFVTQQELLDATKDMAKKGDIPDVSKFATKSDVDAIKKLVDEFRDEIAALGVDVDALKRDVQALGARVDAIEAEMKRVRFTGEVNVFAITESQQKRTDDQGMVDLDNRLAHVNAAGHSIESFGRFISVVKDFDLNIVGRVGDKTTANATINYGDYLNYLGQVDGYVGGTRPTSAGGLPSDGGTLADNFFPYYLYIDTGLGKGDLTVGRFPLQFTPYTLKKIDVDSYTTNLKTDDGNYPVDGIKLAYMFGGVDVTLFAAKNDENIYLANGLAGQPGVGIGNFGAFTIGGVPVAPFGPGLGGANSPAVIDPTTLLFVPTPISQSAGARINVGTPWNGKVGLTYYQAWSEGAYLIGASNDPWDQVRVFGGDLNIPFAEKWAVAGSWTRSDTLKRDGAAAGIDDINGDNTAWDGKVTGGFGALNVGVGYKRIERNFAAAGYWDKIGRWTNPTNVQGPYLDLTYPIMENLKFMLNGEFQRVIDTAPLNKSLQDDDTVIKGEAGVKWGFTKCNAVEASYQWIRFDPKQAGSNATETYITVGLSHMMSPNANVKIGYQLIDYKGGHYDALGAPSFAYGSDGYKGGLGVVQMGVSF